MNRTPERRALRVARGAAPPALILALAALALGSAAPARAVEGEDPPPAALAPVAGGGDWALALPLPAPAEARPFAPAAAGRTLLDDFEGAAWPARDRWVQVLDLDGAASGEHVWAPRDCHPAAGARALWAVGGGREGAGLACGAAYPGGAAASALLFLDLSGQRQAARLGLVFDIWADAAPNDGLFVNYVVFDQNGTPLERRTVYSATGRARAWARGIRLDLADLRDRADAGWRMDLRGRQAYLEFLFVSLPGPATGEGLFLDNLAVDSEDRAPPTPTPGGNQTVGCSGGGDCATLTVRAFVDGRCDGRYQPGLDAPLPGARVEVTAGAVRLGAALSRSGHGFFRVPTADGVTAQLVVPDGTTACANGQTTVALDASAFRPFGRKHLDFRVSRRR